MVEQAWWDETQDVDKFVSEAALSGARKAYSVLYKLLHTAMYDLYDVGVRIQVAVRFGNGEVKLAEYSVGYDKLISYLKTGQPSKEGEENDSGL